MSEKKPWFLERWNDALWGISLAKSKRKGDFWHRVCRATYLLGKVIDR